MVYFLLEMNIPDLERATSIPKKDFIVPRSLTSKTLVRLQLNDGLPIIPRKDDVVNIKTKKNLTFFLVGVTSFESYVQ